MAILRTAWRNEPSSPAFKCRRTSKDNAYCTLYHVQTTSLKHPCTVWPSSLRPVVASLHPALLSLLADFYCFAYQLCWVFSCWASRLVHLVSTNTRVFVPCFVLRFRCCLCRSETALYNNDFPSNSPIPYSVTLSRRNITKTPINSICQFPEMKFSSCRPCSALRKPWDSANCDLAFQTLDILILLLPVSLFTCSLLPLINCKPVAFTAAGATGLGYLYACFRVGLELLP